MIAPICDKADCQRELDEPGALVFSPPDSEGKVQKLHLCRWCFHNVMKLIKGSLA